jgi:putative endonuclease
MINNMQEGKRYYFYILASKRNGTLYIGMTNDLIRRVKEHKEKIIKGFTEKYDVNFLVYYEVYGNPGAAIYREKCVKKWNRGWKLNLIEKENPDWKDLYDGLLWWK